MTPQDLEKLDHATLYRLRGSVKDPALQNLLANYEHRAFAREAVGDNPLMAAPIGLATPIWTLMKTLGATNSRSAPSLKQMGSGFQGIGEGLSKTPSIPGPSTESDFQKLLAELLAAKGLN